MTDSAHVLLTVPAAWDAKGCDMMREAAIAAGLVQSAHAGDRNWRDRLRIITEPEAAAVHCAHLSSLHHLKPSQNFIVCDAGGGTVDLAGYKVCIVLELTSRVTPLSPSHSLAAAADFCRLSARWRTWKLLRCALGPGRTVVACSLIFVSGSL